MKLKFVSHILGKRLVIGGGVVLAAAIVYIFFALRPGYSGVDTCNTGGPCGIGLDGLAIVFSMAVYAIVLTVVLIISGMVIIHLAKNNKESTK